MFAAVLASLAAFPAAAQAATPSLDRARAEAQRAVAPLPVEGVVCVHQPTRRAPRRVVCLVGHPAAEGAICRSLVIVTARRSRVRGLNLCSSRASLPEAVGSVPRS